MRREAGYEAMGANSGSSVLPTAECNRGNSTMESLHAALAAVLPDLRSRCRDPWVVIGSAAACLVGADVSVADLDLLTSVRDADALRDRWQRQHDAVHRPDGAERFRSRFARYRFVGLPVEVMGGLEVFGPDGWMPLRIDRIVHVSIAGLSVPVPAIAEQIRVLDGFGRPKDRARMAVLKTLCEVGE
ncbi:hypothetical protein HDE76_000930 [Rhodanobacter sp. ANJX3]|uniref:hypothetical protein n=1 Tax=Rhodanobacter sp. ANJX3 TaxID=2723083 RepID=UPI00185B0DC5|nr:hypothetical protein [Rhodanobacter sp. ANJX3]MBB5357748.1 hypothetical protein [Rhodanobacter sp. ANJX3]